MARAALPAPARAVARLFSHLLARDAPVLPWLPRAGELCAWLNTPDAEREARIRGLRLYGAPARVVGRCHDKAFAHRAASAAGLVPGTLCRAIRVLEPDDFASEAALDARLREAAATWPAAWVDTAVLKPRHGTSGRGHRRLSLHRGSAALDAALRARLAEAGGALLEPWQARVRDLSVQMYVPHDGPPLVVGSPELVVSRAGGYRGHRGCIDGRGRVTSGLREEEAMREAAVAIAAAAHAAGYVGPCGIDGYVYAETGCESLRPVVELNARLTVGTLVAIWVRALLPVLRGRGLVRADRQAAFSFSLSASDAAPLPGAVRFEPRDAQAPEEATSALAEGPVLWIAPATDAPHSE